MPFNVKLPLSLSEEVSSDNVPVPKAPVTVGGNSWSPVMDANNVTTFWAGAGKGAGTAVTVSPPQAASIRARTPVRHHLVGITNVVSVEVINLFSSVIKADGITNGRKILANAPS